MAWSCSGTTLAGRFAWTKVWGRGHCLLNPCHSGPESCFVLVRFIRSLYVLGSVLLVVQLSLVCGIFQQPAMSASPGPKPFWPDGRTWAVRTHRNVPMPLQRQWTVKAVVCSCICAWFILIHQCSQHLLFQPWLIMLIPLGSSLAQLRKNQWFQWNSTRAQRCPRLPRRWHRIQTVTDAELKHLENKQSCRAFHCSELWIGYKIGLLKIIQFSMIYPIISHFYYWIIDRYYCVLYHFLSFSMNVFNDVSMAPRRRWILPRWQLHLCHQRWDTTDILTHTEYAWSCMIIYIYRYNMIMMHV